MTKRRTRRIKRLPGQDLYILRTARPCPCAACERKHGHPLGTWVNTSMDAAMADASEALGVDVVCIGSDWEAA